MDTFGHLVTHRGAVGHGNEPQDGDIGDGGTETLDGLPTPGTASEMAARPVIGGCVEFAVAQVVQPSSDAQAGTVTEHSHELHSYKLHAYFDARTAVNDPPVDNTVVPTTAELDDFLALVTKYEQRVRSVAARLLDDPRDIEEAVQDTFVQAWRHRDRFRSESAVFTWLYRIATNTALMRLRRRRHPMVRLDDLGRADMVALSDDPLDAHPERLIVIDEVRAALAELADLQRIVVLLRDVEGHSNAEVAELLGLPVTTVKAHLHRGRATLRRRLHP